MPRGDCACKAYNCNWPWHACDVFDWYACFEIYHGRNEWLLNSFVLKVGHSIEELELYLHAVSGRCMCPSTLKAPVSDVLDHASLSLNCPMLFLLI